MFDNLLGGAKSEEKQMIRAESRDRELKQEQATFNYGAQESMVELKDQENRSDLIKWQQDLDEDLLTLAQQLTGWVKVNGVWQKTGRKPMCNDRFMDDIVKPQCTPFVSRNLINSNFSEERILMDLKSTSNDIADNMADGYDVYDIDFKNYDVVLRLIKNTIKSGAFRALNGWTKKTDSTNFKRVESSFDSNKEDKKPRLFGFPSN